MTDGQRRIWLDADRALKKWPCNESVSIIKRGSLDVDVFRQAFDEFLRRHEAWRTTFVDIDGEPVQVIHDRMDGVLAYADLTNLAVEARQAEALAMAEGDTLRPFDLAAGPLFRARLAKLAEDDHRLTFAVHSLIVDGMSLDHAIVPELAAIYAAFEQGRPHGLTVPVARNDDHAARPRRAGRRRSDALQLEYWRRTLRGPLPTIRLPTDRTRPVRPINHRSMETFEVPPDLLAGLREVSRRNGVTPYMTIMATFGALLHRYGRQEDMVVGGVAAMPRPSDARRTMACRTNPVALRTRPAADMAFRTYLHHVRDVVIGAIENGEVPFDHVVRSLGDQGEGGTPSVFRVMLVLEDAAPVEVDGWRLATPGATPRMVGVDLHVGLTDAGDRLLGRIAYPTDLFDGETIRDMVLHWTSLMRGAVADPATTLNRLPMMDADQLKTMLALSVGEARPMVARTLPEHARAAACGGGSRVAVVCAGQAWTHARLWRRVDEIAVHLRLAGIGRGDVVAVCLTRGHDGVAAPLAVMQLGASYLPLDPSIPAARLDAIVGDACPAMLVTNRIGAGLLPGWGIPVLACDDLPVDHPAATSLALADAHPDDVAYVAYAAGSADDLKGIAIRHRSLVGLLESVRRVPGFGERDVMLATTALASDVSVVELFLPLVAGGTVVVATTAEADDPALQAEALAREGCTVMQGTPATWQALFAAGWPGRRGLRALCGGEAPPRELADRMLDAGMELWNLYGRTETTIWSAVERVGRGPATIGRPIDNTHLLVVDAAGRPQPPNAVGDLLIGGVGLARDHSGKPPARDAFTWVEAAGGELFHRTGDVAVMRRDGRCERLARHDGQVEVRGHHAHEPPRGDVELRLAAIWREMLSLGEIGVTDGFQDLGGHSLLAARLVGRIEAEFGCRLQVSALLRASTIRTMASLVERGAAPTAAPPAVTIREGTGWPLFWIDAVPNFRPGYYRAMAAAIGGEQAVVGLPLDLDRHGDLRDDVTIADLADDLADRLQAHPSGPPYMLGGWCNGGILAHAVAAEIERRGGGLSLVALLDAANPARYRTVGARLRHQAAQFATLPVGCRLPFAVEITGAVFSRFWRRHVPTRTDVGELLDLNDRFTRIVKRYDPARLRGRTVLFQPREGKIDYAPGWRGLAGTFHDEEVAGGHLSVLDPPHVADLGRRLANHIARARRAATGRAVA